ncbi:MAG: hypothetical protein KDG49_21320, partial [Geminicoccaceae bacterium]|nr:hypothetical protein [Geminicoccaceae bacterium]
RGIFERVKGIAFPRGFTGHGPETGNGQPLAPSPFRREPALAPAHGPAEPAYEAPAPAEGAQERGRNATPSQDELGDFPAFLRKERVES